MVAFAGLERVNEFVDDPGIFGAIADDVLGTGLSWIVVLAIVTSALASTQTTILPASRTSLSMARQGAFPEALGRVHPRFQTPHVSTIAIGVIAAVWYVVLNTALAELPVRLAHRAVADDRLLLRAHRLRVRDLLPP